MKQLKKVNHGTVGWKVVNSGLRGLQKVECDGQRPESAKVVKNNLQIVKDMVTEKIRNNWIALETTYVNTCNIHKY